MKRSPSSASIYTLGAFINYFDIIYKVTNKMIYKVNHTENSNNINIHYLSTFMLSIVSAYISGVYGGGGGALGNGP